MKTDTLSKKEYIVVPPHASPTGRYHVQTYSTLAGVLYGTHHTIVLLPLFVRLHGGKEITRNCIAVCYVLSLSPSLSLFLYHDLLIHFFCCSIAPLPDLKFISTALKSCFHSHTATYIITPIHASLAQSHYSNHYRKGYTLDLAHPHPK